MLEQVLERLASRSGPTPARRAARSRRPRRAGSATSCSATYGGFDTIELEPAPQRRRAARRTTSPTAMRTRVAAQPAMLARATSSASALTSVAQTTTSGSSASSASAIAPEPVPMSATAAVGSASTSARCRRRDPAQPAPLRLLERDLHDLLGLRARDEHAPVDHEVEPAERPRAEHVLQRLAGDAALDQRPQPRERASRRRLRRRSSATRRPRSPTPPRRGTAPRPRRSRCPRPASRRATSARVLAPGRRAAHGDVSLAAELAPAFVGRERVDDLVEVAGRARGRARAT